MAADTSTCFRANPANVSAKMHPGTHSQELAPGDARTTSTAWGLISAAASCLLVLFIMLLKAILYAVTNRQGRFLWLFFRTALLRPSTVDRTRPEHDKDSAATRGRDPISSHVSVQPPSTIRLPAASRQNVGDKRPGDDGSDAEGNDRGKRPRVHEQDSKARPRVCCPFKVYYPDDPKYERCGTYSSWARLREHLLDRKHRPRDRCATCGEIFFDDIAWDLHTSARLCESSPRELERPFWVERHQAESIRGLSTQGRKTRSIEEMNHDVCLILFGSEVPPDGTARGPPTWSPRFEHTGDLGMDKGLQQDWTTLKQTTADLLGMQVVPQDDSMQQVVSFILSFVRSREKIHVLQNHEAQAGEPAGAGHLEANEAVTEYWMPPAAPTEEQGPQASGSDEYATRVFEGQLDDSLSAISTYLQDFEGAGNPSPPISSDPGHAFSAGHSIDEDGTGYVDPALLQRTDAHHTHLQVLDSSFPAVPPSPTSTALPPRSTASQASEATVLGSSSSQFPKDADGFDFNVE